MSYLGMQSGLAKFINYWPGNAFTLGSLVISLQDLIFFKNLNR